MNHKHLMGLTIIILIFGLSALAKGDVVLLDDFDGVTLNPQWSKSYQNVVDPYWNYSFSTISSNLTVSEILPDNNNSGGGGTWSKIILSRNDFDPLGNFTVTCNFSWDEEGQDNAMQNLWFQLYDDSNNLIAQAGYYDPWCLHEGSKYAVIGLESTEYDYPPLAGDASVIISREGSDVNVYWDDQLVLTGTNDSPFSRIDIAFYYYPNVNPSCQSIFGTESVDLVKIEDEAEITDFCPPDTPQDCGDGTCCSSASTCCAGECCSSPQRCCHGECCSRGIVCCEDGHCCDLGENCCGGGCCDTTDLCVFGTCITIGCPFGILYGIDSEEVELLRKYRDEVLRTTPVGQEIIRLYYLWSPAIVKVMEEDEAFREELKETIDWILPMIREEVE